MHITDELKKYYDTMRDPLKNERYNRVAAKVAADMERFMSENPKATPLQQKSQLHASVAEHFEPIVFKGSPFFYEMGVRPAASWGFGGIGAPYYRRRESAVYADASVSAARRRFDLFCAQIAWDKATPAFLDYKNHVSLYRIPTPGFDTDHNSIGYREILSFGLETIIEKINARLADPTLDASALEFCACAKMSLEAVLKIAEKFAIAAEAMLPECESEQERKYMRMMASAASRVPKKGAESFYEGLATIWFMREITGSLEYLGVSVLGQIDMMLADLYEKDIANGALTKEEARELIYLWLIPTDIRFTADTSPWPETSTCLALGGCDGSGAPVFNDITRMIIEVHSEHHLIAPKLNLRYSKNSPDAYIDLISEHAIKGHNNFALSCDDVIIPALMRAGASEEDARAYLNGGCQETMIEGKGHSAGAYLYVLLPAILDLSLNECEVEAVLQDAAAMRRMPEIIEEAESFEIFYEKLLANLKKIVGNAVSDEVIIGKRQKEINPCPLFSSLHEGCIESGKDYTEGGAKYNFSTICLCGIATLADSVYVIKRLVYEDKVITLSELRRALLNNWEGSEDLRMQCIRLPKYGHGNEEADLVAKRLIADLNTFVTSLENERGGKNILSTFAYYFHKNVAQCVRATADGRAAGDFLSQGISASILAKTRSATEILETIATVGYNELSGISVADLMLNEGIGRENMSAIIRAYGASGCPNLQLNVMSREKLIEAQKSPAEYAQLIVRVSGVSVYFVNLEKSRQDEIIGRSYCNAG